ncbi:MAG: PIN domain-containing protein [Ancylobacter novellus]|uniref:PIN domain-containing protein n=1 Tax=Ancylobacter novellus TaxID=921 RepID=A0A2W5M3F1_ANCNO|nr:MAG: PIN domain-containing protein [Ancylobacter novellus]
MFIDACAIVSVLSNEPEADGYKAAIDRADAPWTSALAAFEAVLVLARPGKLGVGYSIVHELMLLYFAERGIALKQLGDPKEVLRNAVTAAERHGSGRKKLSTFDCFHYAAAKAAGSPMLTLDRLLRETDVPTLP